ncbi:hypothetical protein PIB30_108916, partial [Stylosanthes scabra]|nr:hypothetical protein [Stylosanthes scabra]
RQLLGVSLTVSASSSRRAAPVSLVESSSPSRLLVSASPSRAQSSRSPRHRRLPLSPAPSFDLILL